MTWREQGLEIPSRLWTTHEVGEFLGLSEKTVRRLVAYHGLPCMKLGRTVRFDPASVASWARRQGKEV